MTAIDRVLTADEFMAKHASKLLQSPEWQDRGLLGPEPEHTYEAHDSDGNTTTTLAVVLDEEGS